MGEPSTGQASRATTPKGVSGSAVEAVIPLETASSEQTRVVKDAIALTVRVFDIAGRPISQAVCDWQPLIPADFSGLHTWGTIDWKVLDAQIQTCVSAEDGIAEFAAQEPTLLDQDSVVWVRREGYEAAWQAVTKKAEAQATSIELVLQPAAPLVVRVVEQDNAPAIGALVHVVGMSPRAASAPWHLGQRAFRSFHRSLRSDDMGIVTMPALPGTQVIWAEQGDEISLPVLDVAAGPTVPVLKLGHSFSVSGRVQFTNGALYSPGLQVTAYAWVGGTTVRAAQSTVNDDGTIPAFRVPVLSTDGYDLVLRGSDSQPRSQRIEVPSPGDHIVITYELTADGLPIQVRAMNEAGVPLGGASVLASWETEGGGAQIAVTDDDGKATVRGIPPTYAKVRVQAKGYVPKSVDHVDVTAESGTPIDFTLVRGGSLQGQVVHAGEHVEAFSVVYWNQSDARGRIEVSFQNAHEGKFVIDGVAVGDLLVYACSSDCPRSEIKPVLVSVDTPGEVLLELPDALTGNGQVVDSATGGAVPSARVQLWNSYRAGYLTPFGKQHAVGADGRFVIKGFPPGDSRFVVRADGYAQYLGQSFGRVGEELQLGVIALHHYQRLRVRLTSATAIDFTQYEANADGNAPYPTKRFNAEGFVDWYEAGPSLHFVRLYLPDRSRMFDERYCRPGTDWEFVFPLDLTCTLNLEFVDASGRPAVIEGYVEARLSYVGPGGHPITHTLGLDGDGQAHFSTVAARRVYAEVLDKSDNRLASAYLTLQDGANTAQLKLGGKRVRVRVTNRDGAPVEGATLDAKVPVGEFPWFQLASTDAKGEHTFTGLGMPKLYINVQHNQFGTQPDVEVDLDRWKDDDILEIVLEARSTLAVRLLDGETPLPAASLRFLAPHTQHIVSVQTTDAHGVARYGPVAEGSYIVAVEQPGVWLTQTTVEAGDDGAPRDVQVRRVGALHLQLASSTQQSVAGIHVELVSADSGATLSDWLARGLVTVDGGVAATDASGLVRIQGLPHGEYLVRLTSTTGTWAAGRVTVNPGAPTNAQLSVP